MDPLQKKPYVKAGHEGKLDRGPGVVEWTREEKEEEEEKERHLAPYN